MDAQRCEACGSSESTMFTNVNPDSLALTKGTVLRDKFEVGDVIGYGGFGVTYKGINVATGSQVAIREYMPVEFCTRVPGYSNMSVYSDAKKGKQFDDGRIKFLEEGERIAALRSEDGFLEIYDVFEDNKTAYLITEYLPGETLAASIGSDGGTKHNSSVAIELMLPLVKSLKNLHDTGLYHLGITPDNIFITDGKLKLIDFSAYRHVTTSHSRSLSVVASPGYSSMELYRSSGDLGAHTDVYGLGAVLYRLLTGVTPPDVTERYMRLEHGKADPLKSIRKYNKSVTVAQENAILNAMNVNIKDRSPDVATFAAELKSSTTKRRKQKVTILDIGSWPLWAKGIASAGVFALIAVAIFLITYQPPQVTRAGDLVRVPDVINQTIERAERLIEDRELLHMITGREPSALIPLGMVLSQSVSAGTFVPFNTMIDLVISGGETMARVPFVIGLSADEAESDLIEAGFEVRRVYEFSRFIVEDAVVRTSLGDEALAHAGITVMIFISSGPDPESDLPFYSDVPNVEGLLFEEAMQMANAAGFAVEVIQRRYSGEPRYTVISQTLPHPSRMMTDNVMGLIVSLGERMSLVHDVRFIPRAEAEDLLRREGLSVTIVTQVSDEVVRGNVISQSVDPGLAIFGTAVTLVVSEGSAPFMLPSVTGQSESAAREVLSAAGLMIDILHEHGTPVGNVLRQSPASGSVVTRGDRVQIVVATQEPPIPVPSVSGMERETEQTALIDAGFRVRVLEEWHDTVAAGRVFAFSPTGSLARNTEITIIVSLGREPINVPTNLTGMDISNAQMTIMNIGLVPAVVRTYHDTVAVDRVISQSPASGTLFRGDTVTITASNGPEPVAVPNLVGQTVAAATNLLAPHNFSLEQVGEEFSTTTPPVPQGSIMRQSPQAGHVVPRGSAIDVIISLGARPNFTVSYHANGGTGTMQSHTVPHGMHHFAEPSLFVRQNYVFSHWATQPNGSGETFLAGERIANIQEDIRLYAVWTPGRQITISYHANGGTGTMSDIRILENTAHVAMSNGFTHPQNYSFLGWGLLPSGSVVYNPGNALSNTNNDVRLYAIWQVPHVPVTRIEFNITPTDPIAGQNIQLSAEVAPANATNRDVVWSIVSAGGTGATPSGNTISGTNAPGVIQVRATIVAGVQAVPSIDFSTDFSISVGAAQEPPQITSANNTRVNYGQGGTFQVAATGNPQNFTFALNNAPAGVTIDSNSGLMTITTAVAPGSHTFGITVSNGVNPNATMPGFTLIVDGAAPVITSAGSFEMQAGTAGTFQVTATGAPAPQFGLNGAPTGVTIDLVSGAITIAATVPHGTHNFSITAQNGTNPNASQQFTLTLTQQLIAPGNISPTSAAVNFGAASGVRVTATGVPEPTFALSGQPSGVSINATTGEISIGAGLTVGAHNFTVTATNSAGSASETFTITVSGAAPTVSGPSSHAMQAGQQETISFNVAGNPAPTVTLAGAPSGISINDSGAMTIAANVSPGVYTITITATSTAGSDTHTLNLTINQATERPVITSAASTSVNAGQGDTFQVTATGVPAVNAFSLEGAPAGVTINNAGIINIAASVAASPGHIFNIIASNGVESSLPQQFTLVVVEQQQAPVVSGPGNHSMQEGQADTVQFNATGVPAITGFSLIGAPGGVIINSSGVMNIAANTPAGTHNITVQATNAAGTGEHWFTLVIIAAPPAHVPVIAISNLTLRPGEGNDTTNLNINVGDQFELVVTVTPNNATNRTVVWAVLNNHENTTGSATLSGGNILTAVEAGTVIIRATVRDGVADGEDFYREFTITIRE